MVEPCRKIKTKKMRSGKPIVVNKTTRIPCQLRNEIAGNVPEPYFPSPEEESPYEEEISFAPPRNLVEELRDWVRKQRFIPQDLSNDFLTLFLSGSGFDVDAAAEKLQKYFYSRQEPSYLFRERDPSNPENVKLLEKLYAFPMPDTTEYGSKIILMGAREPMVNYIPVNHSKLLAMVLDLLIWENDFGFGDFIVVFDGRNFVCPQLLEKRVDNHRSITSLLLETIPGMLRSFYLLYPPSHVAKVADNRNELWITVVRRKQQMIRYLPADILPLEFGGNLGHLEDLLEQWHRHLTLSRDFFIHFEKEMIKDYRRRTCHEREVREGGRAWIHRMKLEADEWEYKIQYYEKMKSFRPIERAGFGKDRREKLKREKITKRIDPMEKFRKLLKEEKEANLVFEPTYLYHGYAPEIRKAKILAEQEQKKNFLRCIATHPFLQVEIMDC